MIRSMSSCAKIARNRASGFASMKFSSIVVGYDGSETAGLAATEAADLARGLSAELHLVNVVDNDQLRQGTIASDDQELAESLYPR